MDTLKERLLLALAQSGLKQRDLVRATGAKAPSVTNWLNGRTKNLKGDNLTRAAALLNVNTNWLASGIGSMRTSESRQERFDGLTPVDLPKKTIPLISWITAGQLSDVVDIYEPGQAEEWISPNHAKPSKTSFALRVEGDSMTGGTNGVDFPEGCIIIVDPERAPKSGDYVVAKDVVTQKATFKKLMTDGANWYLKPLNSAYPTKEIDDPALRVIGVVIEWQNGGKL